MTSTGQDGKRRAGKKLDTVFMGKFYLGAHKWDAKMDIEMAREEEGHGRYVERERDYTMLCHAMKGVDARTYPAHFDTYTIERKRGEDLVPDVSSYERSKKDPESRYYIH